MGEKEMDEERVIMGMGVMVVAVVRESVVCGELIDFAAAAKARMAR